MASRPPVPPFPGKPGKRLLARKTEEWADDDRTEHMQIFDEEIQHHRFFAEVADRAFKARSSSAPASFIPPSVSTSQWPSLPWAGST